MTVGELIDVVDRNREIGVTLEFMDGNGDVTATILSSSNIVEFVLDVPIESMQTPGKDCYQIWISKEE